MTPSNSAPTPTGSLLRNPAPETNRTRAVRRSAEQRLAMAQQAAVLKNRGMRHAEIAAELGPMSIVTVTELLQEAKRRGWLATPTPSPVETLKDAALDDETLSVACPATLLSNAIEWTADLPTVADAIWNHVTDDAWHTDRWFAADMQEAIGSHVARTLVTLTRAARHMGIDVDGTLASGTPVWATDYRPQAAAERAMFAEFLAARHASHAPVSTRMLAAHSGLPTDRVVGVVREATHMASSRHFPAEGVHACPLQREVAAA